MTEKKPPLEYETSRGNSRRYEWRFALWTMLGAIIALVVYGLIMSRIDR